MKPHEALYDELLDWALSKEGVNEPEDLIEAVAQTFAAMITSFDTPNPVELFRSKVPALEAMIEAMWAQSAEKQS